MVAWSALPPADKKKAPMHLRVTQISEGFASGLSACLQLSRCSPPVLWPIGGKGLSSRRVPGRWGTPIHLSI